jgi:hypothetical protein
MSIKQFLGCIIHLVSSSAPARNIIMWNGHMRGALGFWRGSMKFVPELFRV